MFEKCLMEAEAILNSQKEPFVPVSMVWEEMVKRAKTKGFEVVSLPDFTALLEGDQRFQILPAKKDDDDGLVDDENLDDPEMDQMGFFPEDRVRLRSSRVEEIEPSSEEDEEISSIRVRGLVSGVKQSSTIVTKKKEKPAAKKKTIIKKKSVVKKHKPATINIAKRSTAQKRKK